MVPPQLIAALIGAGVGAGKTALNKDARGDWMSYLRNAGEGAAMGAGMGAPSFSGGGEMGDFPTGSQLFQLGARKKQEAPLPQPNPEIPQQKQLSPHMQAAVELMKARLGRPKPSQFNVPANVPTPMMLQHAQMPMIQLPYIPPLEQRRGYG